jgi:hypothetical protein
VIKGLAESSHPAASFSPATLLLPTAALPLVACKPPTTTSWTCARHRMQRVASCLCGCGRFKRQREKGGVAAIKVEPGRIAIPAAALGPGPLLLLLPAAVLPLVACKPPKVERTVALSC